MRGYSAIGLQNPKYENNFGMIMRNAYNFNVDLILIAGRRFKDTCQDTTKAYKHIPVIETATIRDSIPYDCIPVAVDLVEDAVCLTKFVHPERALYIFGAEDQTLGKSILDYCKYRVKIPTNQCLNLAMATGIVLYDRLVKRNEKFKF